MKAFFTAWLRWIRAVAAGLWGYLKKHRQAIPIVTWGLAISTFMLKDWLLEGLHNSKEELENARSEFSLKEENLTIGGIVEQDNYRIFETFFDATSLLVKPDDQVAIKMRHSDEIIQRQISLSEMANIVDGEARIVSTFLRRTKSATSDLVEADDLRKQMEKFIPADADLKSSSYSDTTERLDSQGKDLKAKHKKLFEIEAELMREAEEKIDAKDRWISILNWVLLSFFCISWAATGMTLFLGHNDGSEEEMLPEA